MLNIQQIDWAKVDNLLPVVIQDYRTAQVLMLGYTNPESLKKNDK
ncbi:bifunctional phosphoribosyl-AMP cyclohydrolase /phosphoribosyl-ATP pyrophosphatase protein [Moraxella caprae]|uniref:Bifunctional phosphoribosyl-AMP cyclohydrolase /phosphoribosyl-ATP pyrophosphatase protein n=1 Tax=Moraxella caprae TaxID=90240 RepID=A0A378QZB8_9GAMM|nr:hypothetical protein [Moraxella caprae]STZ07731.1 bifunctional phosphoribosyl-AMP cyclohydrolase /phosphoribosyl-ATP pyrophosphatase protein [Moraxella caprae]